MIYRQKHARCGTLRVLFQVTEPHDTCIDGGTPRPQVMALTYPDCIRGSDLLRGSEQAPTWFGGLDVSPSGVVCPFVVHESDT